jgi:hypothetical protein
MLGTALTFAVGIGAVVSAFGLVAILRHRASIVDVMRTAGRFSVAAFLLGLGFSLILALVARGRNFRKLSLPLVTGLGAGAGVLYWLFLAFNGGRNWGPGVGLLNFVLLVVMGGGASLLMMLVARRATSAIDQSPDPESLSAGDAEHLRSEEESKLKIPRL